MKYLIGDCRETLKTLPEKSIHCCVTSPPYWGLRDYGVEGQLGLEGTPEGYVEKLVAAFREVHRVLRDDGTLWLNLGDTYAMDTKWGGASGWRHTAEQHDAAAYRRRRNSGLKPKDLVGIPWRVAFALQADGWYLRSDIIWNKPNPMPESVTDRPTKAHEYIFLMAKSERYYYDADSIAVLSTGASSGNKERKYGESVNHPGKSHVGRGIPWTPQKGKHSSQPKHAAGRSIIDNVKRARAAGGDHDHPWGYTRNKRTVWTVTTRPFKGAHFAVFPPDLIRPCILAGCPEGGTVLDPFGGSGTTAAVALRYRRDAILCELNPEYEKLLAERIISI